MVDLMDIFVKGAPMERTMRPVVPGVLQHKEHSDLVPAFRSVFTGPVVRRGHFVRGDHTTS